MESEEEVRLLLKDDRPVQVLVTILEGDPIPEVKGRGQLMAAALEKLAQAQAFADIEPISWQKDVRRNRELPDRDE